MEWQMPLVTRTFYFRRIVIVRNSPIPPFVC